MSNFARAYLSGTHTSAATTINVATGHGTRFTAGKYATIWDTTGYADPVEAYYASAAEIVLVVSVAANSVVVTRAQLGTTARNFNTTNHVYQVFEGAYSHQLAPALVSGSYLCNDGSAITLKTVSELVNDIMPPAQLNWAVSGSVPASQTLYYLPGVDATSAPTSNNRFGLITYKSRIDRFCFTTNANTFSGTLTASLLQTGSTTAQMDLTIGAGVTVLQNITDYLSFEPYDRIVLKLATGGGSGTIFWPTFAARIREVR